MDFEHIVRTYVSPILSRLIAGVMVWLSGYLLQKLGAPIDAEMQKNITEMAVALVVYALIHRGVSTQINPADVAKPTPPLPIEPGGTTPKTPDDPPS